MEAAIALERRRPARGRGHRGRWAVTALGALLLSAAPAGGKLFEADSRGLGHAQMDIVVKEVERRLRSSVVEVTITARGSSVGGSMFILCSLRQLAQLRGHRHIVKLDDQPKRGQMLVGFLQGPDEDPGRAVPSSRVCMHARP